MEYRRIFRLFKGFDNDDGNIVGDESSQFARYRTKTRAEHAASWARDGIIRNVAPRMIRQGDDPSRTGSCIVTSSRVELPALD